VNERALKGAPRSERRAQGTQVVLRIDSVRSETGDPFAAGMMILVSGVSENVALDVAVGANRMAFLACGHDCSVV